MSNFRPVDRETGFLLPPSVEEWLPERHLARFVVEVIEQLDLSAFVKAYRGSGSASYHPSMLLGLLVYGYATGVFSSRKLERATYDSVAFRFIAAKSSIKPMLAGSISALSDAAAIWASILSLMASVVSSSVSCIWPASNGSYASGQNLPSVEFGGLNQGIGDGS